jgi:hypothetical protein
MLRMLRFVWAAWPLLASGCSLDCLGGCPAALTVTVSGLPEDVLPSAEVGGDPLTCQRQVLAWRPVCTALSVASPGTYVVTVSAPGYVPQDTRVSAEYAITPDCSECDWVLNEHEVFLRPIAIPDGGLDRDAGARDAALLLDADG